MSVLSWSCHLFVFSHSSGDFPDLWEKDFFFKLVPDILVIMFRDVLFKSSVLAGFLGHHTSGGRVMLPFTAMWEWKPSSSHHLQGSFGGWRAFYLDDSGESPGSSLGLLWHHSSVGRGREEQASFQLGEDGSLGSPLNLCWQGWRWGLSFSWGIWLQ